MGKGNTARPDTNVLYRIHSALLPGLEPLVLSHPSGTFRGNQLVGRISTWTRLSVYYDGNLANDPDATSFWTITDLSGLAASPLAQDLLVARLRLGLDAMYERHVLLRWNLSIPALRPTVPTEADGFTHRYFCPTDISMGPAMGQTVDLRNLQNLQLGDPEAVAKSVPLDDVEFVHLHYPPSDIKDAKRTFHGTNPSLLQRGPYITSPVAAATACLDYLTRNL